MLTERKLAELIKTPLADTALSLRTVNTLEDHGMLYLHELLQCCGRPRKACDDCRWFVDDRRTCGRETKLIEIPNFGTKTLAEVFKVLEDLGLHRSKEHPTLKKKRRRRRKKRVRRK